MRRGLSSRLTLVSSVEAEPAGAPASPLAALVDQLDALERRGDVASWDKARCYVEGYAGIAQEPGFAGLRGQQQTRAINKALRREADERSCMLPRPSFLSNAKKLSDTWPDIFRVDPKDLSYDHFRRIAICSLPPDGKDQLRAWAEETRPDQATLRQRIKDAVNVHNGIYKPDFELKVSNFWKFNEAYDNDMYGGIHPGIVANLLYWFTEPGDVVLDPLAGTGLLADTLAMHRFYREGYEAEGSGPRRPLMSDIAPCRDDIIRADATVGLPFADGIARLALIDPPYLRIADGKSYDNLGSAIDEWLDALRRIVAQTMRCVRPGGCVAVITDDVLRKDEHQPMAYKVTGLLDQLGLVPRATIYNHNPNFVYTMGPAMMKAMRTARLHCNGCKIIQVGTKARLATTKARLMAHEALGREAREEGEHGGTH